MSIDPENDLAPPGLRAWVEVNPSALRRNFDIVREAVGGGVNVIPMVKADAYGLGVARVVDLLRGAKPFGFGVATVEEGAQLRRLGVTEPVLIFSPIPPASYSTALREGLTPTISDRIGFETFRRAAESVEGPAPFQIEVDTGMGRAGFPLPAASSWWRAERSRLGTSRLAGIFTHLHSADEEDVGSAREQIRAFEALLDDMEGLPDGLLVHAWNSAGALRLPSRRLNAVRPGIFLYGGAVGSPTPPAPVVRVRGRVALIREVERGTSLGYGATYVSSGRERWATVGLGYGDGLPRALGNRGSGLVGGVRIPIIGRISMDMTVVDISEVDGVSLGDPVTFVGYDSGAHLALDEVARMAGTIGYEVLTGLTPRLPRLWMES